ncbi:MULTISPECIES: plasmid pRiA4b ORF-3 family protein [unclassified Streptomyces]|uniref:plasmid pRiA4b ORF-3 family protein n=1 Tax=unclassified Streptomyces TaxID=2593676 RepID=UPI002E2C53D5|nr:plasmid pRiA4b ORF-3 family protein [Streptomyces sp. NBC_01429]
MANTRRAHPRSRTAPGNTVHRIKATLRDSRPPVWRRLEVPSAVTLQQLHHIVQAAFGWEDAHMWVFRTPKDRCRYRPSRREPAILSPTAKRLDQIAPLPDDRLHYLYDFGDGWEHSLLVEAVSRPEPGTAYPRCVTGRRACPPEDSGGTWGYAYLLDVLADPSHEEHEDRLRWLGLESADQFDPAAFDLERINAALAQCAAAAAGN